MEYTDQELLDARELPCRVCSAPVRIGGQMRMRVLQWHVEQMQREGWDTMWTGQGCFVVLKDQLAELRTLPGITCHSLFYNESTGEVSERFLWGYWFKHRAVPIHYVSCVHCEKWFIARRKTAKTCSGACRVAVHRSRQSVE